jgi:hypothetical protein
MPATGPHLSASERRSLAFGVLATTGFAIYGIATGSPSTFGYLSTVVVATFALLRLRRAALPSTLTTGLALLACAHLAGGLVRVGDDVLYNASFATPVLEYDHFVHALGALLGTVVIWSMLRRHVPAVGRQDEALAICVLGGLGLGAANETIEFLATLAHHGAHVGGYTNTGWDLVSNTVGATLGALLIRAQRTRLDGVRDPVCISA